MNSGGQDPWGSFDPYAQLVKSLMPRASSVAVFDTLGELRWSSETTTGPDLVHLVEQTLHAASTDKGNAGEVRMLEGNVPVYLFWLRSDADDLVAIVAILCKASNPADGDSRSFSLVQALLRPALECLRRDLLSRAAITDLNRTVHALDKDLELLLTDPASRATGSDGADELKGLLQQANEHLRCTMAALIVPDKGIVLMRSEGPKPPDNQLVARTHRQLLSMAQMRREPVIINRLAAQGTQGAIPYRILSCPLLHASGRTMGVLGATSAMASVIGAPLGGALVGELGWRTAILGYASMALFGAAVFWLFYRVTAPPVKSSPAQRRRGDSMSVEPHSVITVLPRPRSVPDSRIRNLLAS